MHAGGGEMRGREQQKGKTKQYKEEEMEGNDEETKEEESWSFARCVYRSQMSGGNCAEG